MNDEMRNTFAIPIVDQQKERRGEGVILFNALHPSPFLLIDSDDRNNL